MSSVDRDAWTRPTPPGGDPNRVELPYMLVADTNVERAAMCLDAIRPFKAGVLVARDGDEATRILDRFGPPILLIIDLSLARRDGFAVIEGLRAQGRGRTEIIAWAAFRELSEFAAQRLSGLNVRVLRGAAPADVVQTAIEHAFERHSAAPRADDVFTIPTAEELHEMMAALAEKARHVARTPGIAVYLRAPGTTQFRASVTWTSDSPISHSPYYMGSSPPRASSLVPGASSARSASSSSASRRHTAARAPSPAIRRPWWERHYQAAVSAGVAELVASETFATLVTRARERVRLALEHGHNRVA